MDAAMKRQIPCMVLFFIGLAICSAFGSNYTLGFLSGGLASYLNFFLTRKGLEGALKRRRSQPFCIIFLGFRVVCAAVLLSVSIMYGAHPLGIFAGITCALCVQVLSAAGMMKERTS